MSADKLLAAARSLAPRLEAAAAEIDRERRLPDRLVEEMIDAGLYRMLVPRSLGGFELDLPAFAEIIETVAKGDGSAAWCLSQNAGTCLQAVSLPRRGAEEVLGDPQAVLAGGYGPATARRVQGGYRLTGVWSYASGIRHATWLRGNCRLVDERGEAVRTAEGSAEGLMLFFPASEAKIEDVWYVSGLRGTGSERYSVDELFVPEHRAILKRPPEPGPLYCFGNNQVFSIGFASVAMGLARASLDSFFQLAMHKTPRGLRGLLRDQARVQGEIAFAEATFRSTRAYLRQTVSEVWQAVSTTGELTLSQRVDLRLATTYAIQRCAEVVDAVYHHAGGTAVYSDQPFERRFRDVHAVTQQVQARPDHYEPAGQFLMGLQPDMQWL